SMTKLSLRAKGRSAWSCLKKRSRSTHIVPISKVQAVEIHQSPFDRRLGLATLNIDTAGQAYTGGGPQISNLPIDEAREIAGALAHRASAMRYIEGRRSRI
ncbi:MAG: PH domain-containing protein, partial [Blastocatellia bacterium]